MKKLLLALAMLPLTAGIAMLCRCWIPNRNDWQSLR